MADALSRKLAILLHADVVRSTALVRSNETIAHKRIQEVFSRFSDVITQYNGTAHEIRGDALTAEFSRASDAVSASLLFQQSNEARNAEISDGIVPELRIGIAMGEVVIADNTITGDGIVMAQRLEQLAKANGVCIQEAAAQTIPRRLPFTYIDHGQQVLKGFSEPVSVFAVTVKEGSTVPPAESRSESQPPGADRGRSPLLKSLATLAVIVIFAGAYFGYQHWQKANLEQAVVEHAAKPVLDLPSLAVLPFDNMSNNTEQEYFADGITEDLITDLSKLSNLFVISRNSSFVYKDKSVKIEKVASELNVRYVLEGSVRRAGNQVRINAQLIDGESGGHLWAERYDGNVDNVFALQDEISSRIVKALAVTLTPQDVENIENPITTNPDAYDAYLLGLSFYYRSTREDDRKAITSFKKSIELDAEYSPAYTALAKVYASAAVRDYQGSRLLGLTWRDLVGETLRQMRHPTIVPDVDFHIVQSWMALKKRQHRRAIDEANRALTLSPNSADALEALAEAQIFAGQVEEGMQNAQMAMRHNPAQIGRPLYLMGLAEYMRGNLQAAIDLIQKAIVQNPQRIEYSGVLAAAYAEQGTLEPARAAFRTFGPSISPSLPSLARVVTWFQAANSAVIERYAKNMHAAGANDNGYLPLYKENRLNGDEIRALLFGAKIKGREFWNHDPWEQQRNADGTVEHSGAAVVNGVANSLKQGFGRIVDNMLCERWPEFIESGEICNTIYRVPDRESQTTRRGDYVMVTDTGTHPFRIVQ